MEKIAHEQKNELPSIERFGITNSWKEWYSIWPSMSQTEMPMPSHCTLWTSMPCLHSSITSSFGTFISLRGLILWNMGWFNILLPIFGPYWISNFFKIIIRKILKRWFKPQNKFSSRSSLWGRMMRLII